MYLSARRDSPAAATKEYIMGSPFATTAPASTITAPATENQLSFIQDLIRARDWSSVQGQDKFVSRVATLATMLDILTDEARFFAANLEDVATAATLGERLNQVLGHGADGIGREHAYAWAPLYKHGATNLISWLKGLPTKVNVRIDDRRYEDATVEVPAGRYAIDTQVHAVNGTAFYKVDRPETGRWAGYVFVKQIIGSDEQKLSMKQGRAILVRIAAVGAEAASARYGHEIGECGICGRQLTNDESRARGIGPVCAAKAGW
ncbi:hypothetical protein ADAWI_41 [Mycobacterium phage Adawi]|uniref:Uncharacterized protein n=1 Tax=Mycobacterium phage Adawi TaxID=1354507 RepID=T2A966_9CAUD|nr:hypothetical protein ADAWI_41 [Mycobacterium phage Adawi]AGU91959.1 hypothetical protein ADAWI_41 [Mycobacterium phage Adawi]